MPAHIRLSGRILQQPAALASIHRRNTSSETSSKTLIVIAVIIGVLLCASLAAYFILRSLRVRRAKPTFIPTTWLKKKWFAWTPSSEKRKSSRSLPMDRSVQRSRSLSNVDTLNSLRGPGIHDDASATELTTQEGDNVDRHTSVRSIMTLPAYSASARPTEQVIGREGERAGVDTVVDFPETADEEEARREEQMESLYQIRRVRREERAQREQRRRLRAEVRARGDIAALEELRRQDRQARRAGSAAVDGNVSSEVLVQEHTSRERGRRVSSVSYMDLGIARHDGSRVRADSGDSDRRPLMDAAAQMGGAATAGGRGSGSMDGNRDVGNRARSGSRTFGTHLRNTSTSSLSRFMTPDISDDERSSVDFEIVPTPPGPGSRATSMSNTRPRLRLDSVGRDDRIDSQPPVAVGAAVSGDTGHDPGPPQYDELSPILDANEQQQQQGAGTGDEEQAPAYESPVASGAPRLPGFARLPSIRVTPFTP